MCSSNKKCQLLLMMTTMMISSSPGTKEPQNGRGTKHVYSTTLVCKVTYIVLCFVLRAIHYRFWWKSYKKAKVTTHLTILSCNELGSRSDVASGKGTSSQDKLKQTKKRPVTSLSEYFGSAPVKQKELFSSKTEKVLVAMVNIIWCLQDAITCSWMLFLLLVELAFISTNV